MFHMPLAVFYYRENYRGKWRWTRDRETLNRTSMQFDFRVLALVFLFLTGYNNLRVFLRKESTKFQTRQIENETPIAWNDEARQKLSMFCFR